MVEGEVPTFLPGVLHDRNFTPESIFAEDIRLTTVATHCHDYPAVVTKGLPGQSIPNTAPLSRHSVGHNSFELPVDSPPGRIRFSLRSQAELDLGALAAPLIGGVNQRTQGGL